MNTQDELTSIRQREQAARGCTSDPCGSKVCQSQRDRARLLAALDAVEKVRKELFDLSNDEGWSIDRRATYRDASRAIYTAVNKALEAGK